MPNPTRIIIIHGTGGSPKGNWFPWLKERLLSQNQNQNQALTVEIPAFPTLEGQNLTNYD